MVEWAQLDQARGVHPPGRERRVVFRLTSLFHQKPVGYHWFSPTPDDTGTNLGRSVGPSECTVHSAPGHPVLAQPQFTVGTSVGKYTSTSQQQS